MMGDRLDCLVLYSTVLYSIRVRIVMLGRSRVSFIHGVDTLWLAAVLMLGTVVADGERLGGPGPSNLPLEGFVFMGSV